MLIVRVFVDTGLCAPFDPRPYAPDWHCHRSDERYLGFVFDHCAEVEVAQPGDVIVFKYGRCYSHGGIVTRAEPLTFVHAYWPARVTLEEDLARNVQLSDPRRARRFFSYWRKAGGELSAHKSAGRHAGLYRPAIADVEQRHPDRHCLWRDEDRAEYHLEW